MQMYAPQKSKVYLHVELPELNVFVKLSHNTFKC